MSQIFSIIGIALGIVGISVVYISSRIDKRQKELIKKLKKRIERKNSIIETLEQENEFLKHQAKYNSDWLNHIPEKRECSPNELLKQAVMEANVSEKIKEQEMQRYENSEQSTQHKLAVDLPLGYENENNETINNTKFTDENDSEVIE